MRAPRTGTLVEGIFGIPQGYLLLGHSPIFPQKPSNKTQGQPRRGVECSPCIFMIIGTQIFNVACTHHPSMILFYSIRRGDAGTDTRGFTPSGSSRSNGDLRSPLRSPYIPRTKVQVLELDSRQKFKLTVFIHHTNKANLLCA